MANLSSIFKHQTTHNPAIINLLENTVIGTNGTKYRHLHTAQKISDLHQPHFFTLYRNDQAMANITICERPMQIENRKVDTFYIRYFAFHTAFQTNSVAKQKKKPSLFQKYALSLLTTSNLNVEHPEYEPKIFWAIIDPDNSRSLQMGDRYGFESIAKVKTVAFSRIKLSPQRHVVKSTIAEYDEIWKNIQSFYKDYNGLTKVHLFKNDNYFVLKNNGQIVAGIQANKVEWRIESMPGTFGKTLARIMPYIPFLNRIINPKKYQFLATEGLFWKQGFEHKIQELLEGVLHIQQVHSLLLWTDARDSKINTALKDAKLGLLQKVKKDNTVNVMAKFNSVDENLKQSMKNSLHYISGFDCT